LGNDLSRLWFVSFHPELHIRKSSISTLAKQSWLVWGAPFFRNQRLLHNCKPRYGPGQKNYDSKLYLQPVSSNISCLLVRFGISGGVCDYLLVS
jgi:hypothetical protein